MSKKLKTLKIHRIQKAGFGTSDIALMCSVTPTTVAKWIDEGKLPASFTAGKHRRVNEADLVAFMRGLRIPLPPKLLAKSVPQVLIVDDDGVDRRQMAQLIRQYFPQAAIHEAVDGFQAGHKLATLIPVLVVLDIMLPGIDGFQVCESLRNDPRLKGIRILAVSSEGDDETKKKILKKGADDFLVKDSNEAVWIEKLRVLLGDKIALPVAAGAAAR